MPTTTAAYYTAAISNVTSSDSLIADPAVKVELLKNEINSKETTKELSFCGNHKKEIIVAATAAVVGIGLVAYENGFLECRMQ